MGISHAASVYTSSGKRLADYDFDKALNELVTIAYIHGPDHPLRRLLDLIESNDVDDDLLKMIDEALERDEAQGSEFVVTPGRKLTPFMEYVSADPQQRWRELYDFKRAPGLRGWLQEKLVLAPIRKRYDPDYDAIELRELFKLIRLAVEKDANFVFIQY